MEYPIIRCRPLVHHLVLGFVLTCLNGAGLAQQAAPPALTVQIKGVSGPLRDNIKAYLGIEALRQADDRTDRQIRRQHAEAAEDIRQALIPFGYYAPTLEPALESTDNGWRARYTITPGPRVTVRTVDISWTGPGADDPRLQAAREAFPLAPGDPLIHARYTQARDGLLSQARRQGYLDVTAETARVAVDTQNHTATVRLVLATGPAYRLGAVRFAGQTLDTDLLQRFVRFEPGAPYRAETLINLQDALRSSEYFNNVAIRPQREAAGPDRQVPIRIDLTPNERQRYRIGGGFGTDTGPRGQIDWALRRVNRAGHRLRATLGASAIERRVSGRYAIPGRHPATDQWFLQAERQDLFTDAQNSERLEGSLGRQWRRIGWSWQASLNLRRERFDVGPDSARVFFLIPELEASRARVDDRERPRRGYRIRWGLQGSSTGIGSETSFVQGTLRLDGVLGLGENAGRLLAKLELGTTTVEDFSRLPASLRFFAGGDTSVRGYAYQSLAPRDANGERRGGERLVVTGLEYDHPIAANWSLAAFVDTGNAITRTSDPLVSSVGLGLRWWSPIGPVRIDLARGLDADAGDRQILHLRIGPAF